MVTLRGQIPSCLGATDAKKQIPSVALANRQIGLTSQGRKSIEF